MKHLSIVLAIPLVAVCLILAAFILDSDATVIVTHATAGTVIVSDSLKAVGSTESLRVRGYSERGSVNVINSLTLQYKVIALDTNVTVALEASHDDSNWYNLDEEGYTVITSDATYAFEVRNISSKLYFRFRMVAETGGANVIIIPKWLFGG